MAHEILGARFIEHGNRVTAWHKIGVNFTDELSVEEAVKLARLNYKVHLIQNTYKYDGIEYPGKSYTIVREPLPEDPQPREFGSVSESYKVIQNTQVFGLLEGLVKEWPIETAGVLQQGATAFMLLKAGDAEILKDPLNSYFLVVNRLDGQHAIEIMPTNVRVVCANTLRAAVFGAKVSAKVNHRHDAEAEAAYQMELMTRMMGAKDTVIAAFTRLALAKVVEEQVDTILKEVFKDPTPPKEMQRTHLYSAEKVFQATRRYEWDRDSVTKTRNSCKHLFQQFNDEQPQLANTAWALWQGITEERDWNWTITSDKAAESVLFGERAADKARAYKIISEVAEFELAGHGLPEIALA